MREVQVERLDHLGPVAGVCQEIELAAYLDAIAGRTGQQVSAGTATVAMILPQRPRLQQSTPVSGRTVLCHQAGRAPLGAGDHRADAHR